jgi:hypothetical protein
MRPQQYPNLHSIQYWLSAHEASVFVVAIASFCIFHNSHRLSVQPGWSVMTQQSLDQNEEVLVVGARHMSLPELADHIGSDFNNRNENHTITLQLCIAIQVNN